MALLASTSVATAQTAPGAQPAQNRGTVRSFDIAAQPLTSAVGVFSRQSGLQVTLASATARGVTTKAVKGSLTPEQALAQMLGGTGIAFRLSGTTAVIGQAPGSAGPGGIDGAIALDAVDVTGQTGGTSPGYQGAPDWIYDTPASISYISRSAILQTTPRSASDLFDGMAGVNTVGTPQDPGITVNVRGLQDQNRVTSTIDGARQNFQMSGHANTGLVYVDPLLLRAVQVDKSIAAGVGAGGSHGSVVAFRTLSAQDLIQPGKDWGAELDLTTGTNAYTFYGLAAVAGRVGKVDATFAITHKELGQYNAGTNGTLNTTVAAQYAGDSSVIFTGSDTWSGVAKLGWDITDDQRLELGFVAYDTEFATSTYIGTYPDTNHLRNLTGTLTYTWTPENGWIDLKAQLWANRTENQQYRAPRSTYGAFDVDYGLDTYGGSIANTSTFAVPFGKLALHYGIEGFYDTTSTGSTAYSEADSDEGWWFTGTNPNGERWMVTPFTKATFTHGEWLEVSAGGRYDYYKMTGSSAVYGGTETITISPRICLVYRGTRCTTWQEAVTETRSLDETFDVDQSGGHFSPEATIAVTPLTGLQVYGKYTGGYRPPGLGETLLGGQHIGAIFNYIPNPNLQPETSRNWEIGVNMKYDNVLRNNDAFRFKAAYFDRAIENFIALAPASYIVSSTTGHRFSGYQAVNLTGTSKLSGVEIEANYDAGDYYVGGAYTLTNSDYSQDYIAGANTSYAYAADGIYFLAVAPEQKFTMDVGLRQFDRRWVIGGKVTHVVPAEQLGMNAAIYEPTVYTVWDVYSSFKFSEQATVRFAVTNLTDVAYVDAMNSYDFPTPGRTATVSLNLRF